MAPLIDAHVHGFPDPLFDAIWRYFIKNYWPIYNKLYADQGSQFLINQGVSRYTILNYAHKPGISREMNDWTYGFGQQHPEALCFGTIHPQDPYLAEEIERVVSDDQLGLRGIKLQLLVTDFDPGIRELDVVYETLIRYGKILVMHAGTAPQLEGYVGKETKTIEHLGIAKLLPVLDRYPDLKLQVPHLGGYEYLEFFDLVKDHPAVHFDTAMVLMQHDSFSDRFDMDTMLYALLDIQDHVMFGSDFPNIPYDYALSLQSIDNLPVSDDVKDKIAWKNAVRFYQLDEESLISSNLNASNEE